MHTCGHPCRLQQRTRRHARWRQAPQSSRPRRHGRGTQPRHGPPCARAHPLTPRTLSAACALRRPPDGEGRGGCDGRTTRSRRRSYGESRRRSELCIKLRSPCGEGSRRVTSARAAGGGSRATGSQRVAAGRDRSALAHAPPCGTSRTVPRMASKIVCLEDCYGTNRARLQRRGNA